MEQSEYIAALDLGTSKMVAAAARKSEQGILSVLASKRLDSGKSIRRGYVYNINDVENKVGELIRGLNSKLDSPIEKVYVGLGGQSVYSHIYSVQLSVNGESVSQDLIDLLYEDCKSYEPEFMEVLDIASPEYFLDGRPETNPVGVICENIEARFQLILGQPTLKSNLEKCVSEKNGVQIAGYFITPLASAEAVLNGNEKELGCALVEVGAGVTSLSVYKNGYLSRLVTIPLGGEVITKDIQDLNVLEDEAEQLKINGYLDGREVDNEKLEMIIISRCEEIVENVIYQIKETCPLSELGAGIVITGGSARLEDIDILLIEKTGMNTRLATPKRSLVNNTPDLTSDPANAAIIGLLSLGKENCARKKEEEVKPQTPGELFSDVETIKKSDIKKPTGVRKPKEEKPKAPGFFSKFGNRIKGGIENAGASLFGDEEDMNSNASEE